MKKYLLGLIVSFFLFSLPLIAQKENVGIGTKTPNESALLDLNSNSKGLLIPRLLKQERNQLLNPAKGLLVFQTDDASGFYYFNGKSWVMIADKMEAKSIAATSIDVANKTIAELRTLSNIDAVHNRIFASVDIGKEGFWKVDSLDTSSSDNLGTILVTSGGKRLKRIFESAINVKWFGANNDGSTDNTAIFQNALNAGNIYVPSGTYSIQGTITIPSNRVIQGEYGTTFLGKDASAGNNNQMFINADAIAGNKNIVFNNIKFDFNRRTGLYVTGQPTNSLKFVKVENLQFNNCEFFDFLTKHNPSPATKKDILNFGMALFDNCAKVLFNNIKSSNIREEGFNFYECTSISFDNWTADGSVVGTSSHAGIWYCDGVSIKNSSFRHTKGSVLNLCSSNVTVDNIKVNKDSIQAGRGLDFGNELNARPFDANNISVTNSYLNVTGYGIQNPSDISNLMAVKSFIIKNNTLVVGIDPDSDLCSGIFLRGALNSVVESNNIELTYDTLVSGIGRNIVIIPYDSQTISSTVKNNTMKGNCAIELYYAKNAVINGMYIQGNTFVSIPRNELSSLNGNSAFFYLRTRSTNTNNYYINNLDINSNTVSDISGSFVLTNLDVASSVNLKTISITNNKFYGTSALAERGIQLGGVGIGGNPVVLINNNYIHNGSSITLLGLSNLKMHNNIIKYQNAFEGHRVRIYAHNGSFEANNNTFINTSSSNAYYDIKQMSAGIYNVMQINTNSSLRDGGSIGFTTDLPANTLNLINKLNLLSTGTATTAGTATLSGGTITVNTSAVTANSQIILTPQETGQLNGRIRVSARTAGSSFTITSSDNTDTATVSYLIIN